MTDPIPRVTPVEHMPLLDRAQVCIDEMTMRPVIRNTMIELIAEIEKLKQERVELVQGLYEELGQ